MKKYTIGIDIGGTHTDAVLVDRYGKIIAWTKTNTTPSLEIGVQTVLQHLLKTALPAEVDGIFVGTTHATNAILERNNLYRVGLIRIAGHRPESLQPCFGWPKEMREAVLAGCETIDGGFECDGREITSFDPKQVVQAIETLVAKGAESLAVVGVFSPINGEQEKICAQLAGHIPITLSCEIGGIGFIERENAAILNSALKRPMEKGFRELERIRDALGFDCPLHVTQNNGSIIDLKQAIAYPLLTVSAGPTNSYIGATRLANQHDAIVVDIGGTSTDIGVVLNGYPQRSVRNATIGGVSLNFRMPDVLALALGGGSYIGEDLAIGPKSAGSRLMKEAQIFGGKLLTLTDIACKMGCLTIEQAKLEQVVISHDFAHPIMERAMEMVRDGVRSMRGKRSDLPVLIVGGGAGIASYDKNFAIVPNHATVANAYGAALAEIGSTIDTIVSLVNREKTLEELKEKVLSESTVKGANNPRIVDVQIIPFNYMPNQMARVIVTATGRRFFG